MRRETDQWKEGTAFLVTYSHEEDGKIELGKITVFAEFGLNIDQLLNVAQAALDYAKKGIGVDVRDIEQIQSLPRPIVLPED